MKKQTKWFLVLAGALIIILVAAFVAAHFISSLKPKTDKPGDTGNVPPNTQDAGSDIKSCANDSDCIIVDSIEGHENIPQAGRDQGCWCATSINKNYLNLWEEKRNELKGKLKTILCEECFLTKNNSEAICQDSKCFLQEKIANAETFTGVISKVDGACGKNSVCYIVVDGKRIVSGMGGVMPQGGEGKIIGKPEAGKKAEVYAKKLSDGSYTLFGNSRYYIEVR